MILVCAADHFRKYNAEIEIFKKKIIKNCHKPKIMFLKGYPLEAKTAPKN